MGYMNLDPGFSAADPLEASEIHEILESAGRQSEEANNRLIRLFENYLQLFRRQTWLDPQQVAGSREMWALLKRSSLQSYETQRRLHELMDDYQRFMARETRPRGTDITPPPAPPSPPRASSPSVTSTPAAVSAPPPPPPAPEPPPPARAAPPIVSSTPIAASAPPPPPPAPPAPAPAPATASALSPTPAPAPPPAPAAAPAPAAPQPSAPPPVPESPSALADAAEESALILSKYSGESPASPHGSGNQSLGAREFILEELTAAGSAGVSMRTLNKRFMNYFSMRSANPVSLWATNISRLSKSGEICTEERVDGRWYRLSAEVSS